MGSIAFCLTEASRQALLKRFSPKYAEIKCDHITVVFGVEDTVELPHAPDSVKVVGYADDGKGVECLVVEIDGSSKRCDGKVFHVTLSRNACRESVESNNVIAELGWSPIDKPVAIDTFVTFRT